MSVTIVVGNPKPHSRTFVVAEQVAERLTGAAPDAAIDLVDLGADLLDWSSDAVADAKRTVAESNLVVFASPTYKGSYTGLLKLFLDRFGTDELLGVTGVALMLGGDLRHSLAPEVLLKPVLVEIGVTVPARALFVTDSTVDDPGLLDDWAAVASRQIAATSGKLR